MKIGQSCTAVVTETSKLANKINTEHKKSVIQEI